MNNKKYTSMYLEGVSHNIATLYYDEDRKVVTYNSYNQMETRPLYEIAISKFARSNFIDTMVGKGVPDNITGTMSGHISGSRAFHRYHNRQKSQQQNEAIAMLD